MAATTTRGRDLFDLPKHHVRCAHCGYGAVLRTLTVDCPMCRSSSWEPDTWRPFAHLRHVWERDGREPTAAA
jgi:hypothetical protein